MDRSEIADKLYELVMDHESVGGAKGSKSKSLAAKEKKALEMSNPAVYLNPYKDDGSLRFEKLKIEVVRNLAKQILGVPAPTIQDMKAVPEKLIANTLKSLREAQDEAIRQQLEKDKKMMKAYRLAKPQIDLEKVKKEMQEYSAANDEKIFYFENPRVKEYVDKSTAVDVEATRNPVVVNKMGKGKYYDSSDEEDIGGKKRAKRVPTAYNKFVKKYAADHPGMKGPDLMKSAAAAWNKQK